MMNPSMVEITPPCRLTVIATDYSYEGWLGVVIKRSGGTSSRTITGGCSSTTKADRALERMVAVKSQEDRAMTIAEIIGCTALALWLTLILGMAAVFVFD
jgi:hypothetical protein